MKIRDFCSRNVVTIELGASLRQASLLMRNHHVGALVAVEGEGAEMRPLGVITDRDIVVAVLAPGAQPEKIRVGDIPPPEPAVVRETEGVFEASRMMGSYGVRRLPVVTEDGRLAGIVTAEDLLGLLCAELKNLASAQSRAAEREIAERWRLASP